MNWHGSCDKGVAQGLGVIKYLQKGALHTTYYGEVKDGKKIHGVLEIKNGGYMPILDPVKQDDRQPNIGAFEVTSKAAVQFSQEFAKANNKASAEHYKKQSQVLLEQLYQGNLLN